MFSDNGYNGFRACKDDPWERDIIRLLVDSVGATVFVNNYFEFKYSCFEGIDLTEPSTVNRAISAKNIFEYEYETDVLHRIAISRSFSDELKRKAATIYFLETNEMIGEYQYV